MQKWVASRWDGESHVGVGGSCRSGVGCIHTRWVGWVMQGGPTLPHPCMTHPTPT